LWSVIIVDILSPKAKKQTNKQKKKKSLKGRKTIFESLFFDDREFCCIHDFFGVKVYLFRWTDQPEMQCTDQDPWQSTRVLSWRTHRHFDFQYRPDAIKKGVQQTGHEQQQKKQQEKVNVGNLGTILHESLGDHQTDTASSPGDNNNLSLNSKKFACLQRVCHALFFLCVQALEHFPLFKWELEIEYYIT
jgi:hypothetical protein